VSTRNLMTAEQLDALAIGRSDRCAEDIAQAVAECYIPLRRAGYSAEQARLVSAGWLARVLGLLAAEELARALLLAAEVAEVEEQTR
jgi:hypothetical protein